MTAIEPGSPFDAIRRTDERGEYWSARELMPLLGYDQWRRFEDAVQRAVAAARNTGADVDGAFTQVSQVADAGNLGHQQRRDYRLTRYAAYLVAMNGDPRKPEIAAAQSYFAVKTREAEVAPVRPALPQSYADALRELAAQVEETERVKAELEAAAPRAQAWDTLASGDGDYSVRDAAKILSRDPVIALGERRLFAQLHDLGWIYRAGDGRWRAYQGHIEVGRLSELPQSKTDETTGETTIYPPQVRVTVKGLYELHRRLGGLQPLRVDQPLLAVVRHTDSPAGSTDSPSAPSGRPGLTA